ncbi:hypothetical protein GO001_34505 [Streptomyces sp. NRRL B-1677]|uniref:hypothetical protein n=1 Tax=Streptomyces TaxID=1883 RepID=UPI001892CDDC|nr:hypothetical protein [Streptomyces sp. NRRL B-1677]MBF6050227.1 hypothetical protein [Streptomyces sp. NRRL B-1677]
MGRGLEQRDHARHIAILKITDRVGHSYLVLGPDLRYLRHVVKTWRMVRRGPLAAVNMQPTSSGKAGDRLASAGQLAHWMAQQPPGTLVLARYRDAGLIGESHRDHYLPPWGHLIIEEAHRTAEGVIGPDHPHAVIHYDDGILAYNRLYLTATPRIPRELPPPGEGRRNIAWGVDMLAQPIFGTHHPGVERPKLVDDGFLSPYQVMRICVPEPPGFPLWRAQAVGAAHVIEQHHLRRVVAVLENKKRAEAFACQLAVCMLDAEILTSGEGAVRYAHGQPVIRCQRATDPMPSDLDAIVLPSTYYSTMDLVNVLSPLMGQHVQRAAQTVIIVPEPVSPHDDTPVLPPVLHRIGAAIWAHNPASTR